MSKYYIAGPMSGIPQFNYPAFDEAAAVVRGQGHEALSPAEMDDPETRAMALASPDGAFQSGTCNGETWGDFLSRDVKIVADEADGVVLLPNWKDSRGARLETFIALTVQKPVFEYIEGQLVDIAPEIAAGIILAYVLNQGDTTRYEA